MIWALIYGTNAGKYKVQIREKLRLRTLFMHSKPNCQMTAISWCLHQYHSNQSKLNWCLSPILLTKFGKHSYSWKKSIKQSYNHDVIIIINPFIPNASFLYPLKTSENSEAFDVFRGYRKDTMGTNGLRIVWIELVPLNCPVFLSDELFQWWRHQYHLHWPNFDLYLLHSLSLNLVTGAFTNRS